MGKVVVCEDDPSIQKLIRAALRSTPHEVRIAADGAAGLALALADPPDLIVTDVSMPLMDGFALGDAVRSAESLKRIPILFMTASVQPADIEECFRHGATAYLGKPFTMGDLRQRIDTLVGAGAAGGLVQEPTAET